MSDSKLELSFDPNTIQHLGVSLYSQLPSVLSELVSNSWDADATEVEIEFVDDHRGKEIHYFDNGHGMSFSELNDKYLVIGRNRREDSATSPGGRRPIGKKGLGKLSVFGVCDVVVIESVKNGLLNKFRMDLKKMLSIKSGVYHPEIIEKDQEKESENYTRIFLEKIRRKSPFDLEGISSSLSKKFIIFDEMSVSLKNNVNNISLSNEMKFNEIDFQFEWVFPDLDLVEDDFEYAKEVKGRIHTSLTPVKVQDMRGVYLTSRGKIVNQAEFYGVRDNEQFHSYVTGYLSIDFIDEDDIDHISTDRHSLNWENDIPKSLQGYLQKVIRKIGRDWRDKRKKVKSEELKSKSIDVEGFINSLPKYEKDLGTRILDPILASPNISLETTEKFARGVIDKFNHADYKDYAEKILSLNINDENKAEIIYYLNDWRVVENKQYAALAETRINVIRKFEEYVDNYTKEVPTLHNFLKDFPWLIDPRILEFDDEVRFSKILKEKYPEDKLDEKDRRIDFLCTNFLGQVLYVVEIKHSNYEIDTKALEQAEHYRAFLMQKYQTEHSISNVVCYVVGGSVKDDYLVLDKLQTLRHSGKVFTKTYTELLQQSRVYHREFLDKHSELSKD